MVEALDENGAVVATGSGVAIRRNLAPSGDRITSFEELDRFLKLNKANTIVTNNHVIDPDVRIRVRQGDQVWPAEINHSGIGVYNVNESRHVAQHSGASGFAGFVSAT